MRRELRHDRNGDPYLLAFLTEPTPGQDYAPPPEPPRADAETLDKTYRAILGALKLTGGHRRDLHARGLSSADIEQGAYRTLDRNRWHGAKAAAAITSEAVLETIPGLYRKDDGKWSLTGDSGLLVPVMDLKGRVVAVRIRPDEPRPGQGKYAWFSSRHKSGPSPGAPLHFPTRPEGLIERVFLTEGELKAAAICALMKEYAISLPGVNAHARAIAPLHELGVKHVVIAFDSDARENHNVARHLAAAWRELNDAGFSVSIATWSPALQRKGLDDLLMTGGSPTIIEGPEAEAWLAETVAEAEKHRGADEANKDGAKKAKGCVIPGKLVRESEGLADAPVAEGMRFPMACRASVDSLTIEVSRRDGPSWDLIAFAPILIARRLLDVVSGNESWELAWLRSGKWVSDSIDRGAALNSMSLLKLASRGLPVNPEHVRELATYLAKFEALNMACIPVSEVSSSLGWLHGRGFLLGGGAFFDDKGKLLQGGVTFQPADAGDAQLAEALNTSGKADEWFTVAAAAASCSPKASLMLAASLAPPLLHALRKPSFVVDVSGVTSKGKSTLLRLAGSCWGVADAASSASLFGSWDMTRVAAERRLALLSGVPLLLDDSQRAKDGESIADIIYLASSGQGRARGTMGGLAVSGSWRTVILSTGEAPLPSFVKAAGAVARVISLHGLPFGKGNQASLVARVDLVSQHHYGWAGPRFAAFVLENSHRWPQWLERLAAIHAELLDSAEGSTVAGRLAGFWAVLELTAQLAREAFQNRLFAVDPKHASERCAFSGLWKEVVSGSSQADIPRAALEDVVGWATGNLHKFVDSSEDKSGPGMPMSGYVGQWRANGSLNILPSELNAQLVKMGYSPAVVLAGWWDAGYLDADKDGHKGKRVRMKGNSLRVVSIKAEVIRLLDASGPICDDDAAATSDPF